MLSIRFFTSALAVLASFGAGNAYQVAVKDSEMTPLKVITNLHQIGLAYADFTVTVQDIVKAAKDRKRPDLRAFVDNYKKLTQFETDQGDAPQPDGAFKELEQFFVYQAAYDVAVLDKAFFETLIAARDVFRPVAPALRPVLAAQVDVVNGFLKAATVFAPDVIDAINATEQSLINTAKKAVDAYSSRPYLAQELT